MRILFLVAKLHTIEPFGVMSLVPMLKRDGHAVRLMEAERGDLAAQVRQFAPDIIGYSVCTGSQRYYLDLNRWLKTQHRFRLGLRRPASDVLPRDDLGGRR